MYKTYNLHCPMIEQEIKMIVDYIPIKVVTSSTISYLKNTFTCSFDCSSNGQHLCPYVNSCKVYDNLPKGIG